jgi:CrcB protein
MLQVLWIGLGGFVGAILRYAVSGGVQQILRNSAFPIGTLAVNLIGSFIFGWLTIYADQSNLLSTESRAFLFVGFLGAFTTFSTFGNDSYSLLNVGDNWAALLNIGFHIFLGVGAIWLGRFIGKSFIG